MKTEQEQIKAIKQIIDERVETTLGQVQGRHDNVIKTVDTIIIARDIVNAGYGDISEYKAEIERLRQEVRDTDKMARNTIEQYRAENKELENALKQSEDNYSRAFERLKAQEREIEKLREDNIDLKEELYELHDDLDIAMAKKDKTIKQAQIDILNKANERLNIVSREFGDDCDLCGVSAVCSCRCEINNLIEEVEKQ